MQANGSMFKIPDFRKQFERMVGKILPINFLGSQIVRKFSYIFFIYNSWQL